MAPLGSVTSSKMAAKVAAILDFTKDSNLLGKLGMYKHFFTIAVNIIQLNILLLLVWFYKFSHVNGFLPNLTKMCLKDKRIATEDNTS